MAAMAAVIDDGIEFEDLLELSGLPEDAVLDNLEHLIRAKVLLEERSQRSEVYRFGNPLLREAALEHFSGRKRRKLHERYARMLEARVVEPVRLAHHWTQAGFM